VTAVFVRNGGKNGFVPMHPFDQKGKTPLNLERGVFSVEGSKGVGAQLIPIERGQKWQALKSPPHEGLSGGLAATGPPSRVSRTVMEAKSGNSAGWLGKSSSIAYDPSEHRFVNSNSSAASSSLGEKEILLHQERTSGSATSATVAVAPLRAPVAPPATRSASSPPQRNSVPPPAPRYSGGERGSSSASGRGSSWGGTSSSGSSSASSSGRSSSSPAPASHPSSGRPH
jgi:hypothetical protein